MSPLDRRTFLKTSTVAAAGLAAARPAFGAPAIRRFGRPMVISDLSGFEYRNGGSENAVERAFRGITSGEDPLDALVAGVNIPELDP
ncbi:MAG: twin-arginine translocation signal domain-containing protein, partial [Gemmatimonadales bacterium]